MSTFYKIAYTVGFRPWEKASAAGAGLLEQFFAREETDHGGPARALDVGCGTGMQTLALARRGWDVTGVDLVDRALGQARARLAEAHVRAKVVKADATTLPAGVVGDGFDFVLDLGCFHGLDPDQRAAMGRAVTARTRPGATLLMLAFGKPVGPRFMPTGATREQIEAAFTDWAVVDVVTPPADIPGQPGIARRAEPAFYRLRRQPLGAASTTPGEER